MPVDAPHAPGAPGAPFASVWFDCDSTLTTIEGVDELLRLLPAARRRDIARLTRQAMEGSLPLADVYERRLRLLAPRRALLERVGRLYVNNPVPEARAVVQALRHLGKRVGIVSGGLLVPVRMLARALGVPRDNVHAVALLHDGAGRYRDIDRSSPLWRNRGKVEVLRSLPPAHRPLAFVGDGVTDLEVQGTADLFVGYGGVAVRPLVRRRAQAWFQTRSLAPVLRFVLTEDERRSLKRRPRFRDLVALIDG